MQCYHNRGGVEEHTKTLAGFLQSSFDTAIIFPERGRVFFRQGEQETSVCNVPPVAWPISPYQDEDFSRGVNQILREYKPNLIHIQHFLNWPLGIIDQLTAFGCPVIMSFHDYFAITPHFTMQFVQEPADTYRAEYSLKLFGADISGTLSERREVLKKSFSKLRCLISPSPFLAQELSKIFPNDYLVIEHGIEPFSPLPRLRNNRPNLKFGFLGTLIPQKGWQSLLKGFNILYQKYPQSEILFFGGGDNPLTQNIPGAHFYGPYSRTDLPRILSEIDVGIIPSIFRETYCYVLSEMWMGGLPVAVADIGALGTRVIDRKNGRKFKPGNPESIAETLSWFIENDEWTRWQHHQPRHLESMLNDYEQLYKVILNEHG